MINKNVSFSFLVHQLLSCHFSSWAEWALNPKDFNVCVWVLVFLLRLTTVWCFCAALQHLCSVWAVSVVDNRQRRVSAVEPGSLLQVVYARTDSVSWGSWRLSCHYPVRALIKWLAHRREAFMKMPDWVQLSYTPIHTRLSLSSPTLSPAADVHVLAIAVLNSHLFILAAATGEVTVHTLLHSGNVEMICCVLLNLLKYSVLSDCENLWRKLVSGTDYV